MCENLVSTRNVAQVFSQRPEILQSWKLSRGSWAIHRGNYLDYPLSGVWTRFIFPIQAADHGGQNLYQILDTRAAVYAKLGQHKEALKDAKKTIDIAPERWQGYARAARVFLQLRKVEPAQTMVMMATERLKETETKRRSCLLSLQADIQNLRNALDMRRRQLTDHINQLPIEVFAEIARIVVEANHTALIPLLHVCKRWRTVIENTPRLWAKLVLTSRRPKPKAKLWIQRSNGNVKELAVKSGAAWSWNWPGNWLDGLKWDNLLVFHSEGWAFLPYLRSIGKEAAMAKWMRLTVEDLYEFPIPLLCGQSGPFSLHSLSLNKTRVDINGTNLCERLGVLRSCTLRNCYASTGSWADIFKANPLLERLELHTILSVDTKPLPTILELDHLTILEADYSVPIDVFTARMPHLRNLKLSSPLYDPDLFIRHLIEMLDGGLTELKLHGCRFNDSTNLLFLLRLSPNLEVLEVTNLTFGVASLLNALAAHYIPPSSSNFLRDEPPSDPPPILCPKLTHVNFSGCPEVQAGLLMRFIKSRLIGPGLQTTSQIQSTEVSKIESLVIDFCPNVEREWVKRMEELVSHVGCRYTTKKMTKSRILG
jgi:F-box/TPR repeat protein Pof3